MPAGISHPNILDYCVIQFGINEKGRIKISSLFLAWVFLTFGLCFSLFFWLDPKEPNLILWFIVLLVNLLVELISILSSRIFTFAICGDFCLY